MNPGVASLEIYRGDTKRWRFILWNDTKKTEATDLAGVTVSATIRDKLIGGTHETQMACVVTTPNIVDVTLTPEQSRKLPATGVWDLQLSYPSGDIYSPLKGNVVVTQDVTRPVATP